MTWDDVDDILYDGTEEQIKAVRCPECGSKLEMSYSHKTRNVEISCNGCGILIRAHGASYTPNFARIKTSA